MFEAVCAEEGSVYLLETGGWTVGGVTVRSALSDRGRLGFEDFIKWHNPVLPNKEKVWKTFGFGYSWNPRIVSYPLFVSRLGLREVGCAL